MEDRTTITVQEATRDRLRSLKEEDETYDDLIKRAFDYVKEKELKK